MDRELSINRFGIAYFVRLTFTWIASLFLKDRAVVQKELIISLSDFYEGALPNRNPVFGSAGTSHSQSAYLDSINASIQVDLFFI